MRKNDTPTGSLHPIDVHVGQMLRFRRCQLGLTQEGLGQQVGITFQQIQKYERGANRLAASRMWEFAKVLRVPVAYFFEGFEDEYAITEYAMPASADFVLIQKKESLKVVRAYYAISSTAQRQSLYTLMKNMANGQGE